MEEARKAGVNGDDLEPWLIAKFGKEKGERFYLAGELPWYYDWSWECRDCIGLNEENQRSLEKCKSVCEKLGSPFPIVERKQP